jgi:hypothetical protein
MKLVRKIRIITLFVHLAFSMVVFLCSESQNQNTLTSKTELKNQSKSAEKINLKTKIFLDSKMLKHKKAAGKTFVSTTEPEKAEESVPNPTEPATVPATAPADKRKKEEAVADKGAGPSAIQAASSKSPVLFDGWVKFFKFSEIINKSLPKKFLRNAEYYEQMKFFPGIDYAVKNAKGEFDYIKSPEYFYLVAFKNIVSFFSSKQVKLIFLSL